MTDSIDNLLESEAPPGSTPGNTENPDGPPAPAPEDPVDNILAKLMEAMYDPDDDTDEVYRKTLIYGPFGAGKTVLAATAPSPLIVKVEATATESLDNHPEIKAKVAKIMRFKSVFQVEMLIDKMIEKPEAFSFCKTLVIDSFSELQKADLDDNLRRNAATDSSRNKFLPTGPDYNENTEHMRMIATKLERMPFHVVLLSHSKDMKDGTTGRVMVMPNLTPKLAGTVAGKVGVIGYLTVQGSGESATRVLQCHPTASVTAKTRVGAPPIIENPTWDKIYSTTPA